MKNFNPQNNLSPRILATDLDGTLIPLRNHPENRESLKALSKARNENGFGLIYATGRHFESVLEAIKDYCMPKPDWIISDVGTSIHKHRENSYEIFDTYQNHLAKLTYGQPRDVVENTLHNVDGLKLQAQENQKRFKISFESDPARVEDLVDQINNQLQKFDLPYDCMGSIDPFENRGLLDVLPKQVTKAYALLWLSKHADFLPDEVVYSGDSGNDLAALVSGFRAIVVANASTGLVNQVREQLAVRDLEERLYVAKEVATSGVVEGCLHFELITRCRTV